MLLSYEVVVSAVYFRSELSGDVFQQGLAIPNFVRICLLLHTNKWARCVTKR